jgi:hypothetical protein
MKHARRRSWVMGLSLTAAATLGIVISLLVLANCDVGLWGSLSSLGL